MQEEIKKTSISESAPPKGVLRLGIAMLLCLLLHMPGASAMNEEQKKIQEMKDIAEKIKTEDAKEFEAKLTKLDMKTVNTVDHGVVHLTQGCEGSSAWVSIEIKEGGNEAPLRCSSHILSTLKNFLESSKLCHIQEMQVDGHLIDQDAMPILQELLKKFGRCLDKLTLSRFDIRDIAQILPWTTNVRYLELVHCSLTDEDFSDHILPTIRNYTSLYCLSLDNNRLTGEGFPSGNLVIRKKIFSFLSGNYVPSGTMSSVTFANNPVAAGGDGEARINGLTLDSLYENPNFEKNDYASRDN